MCQKSREYGNPLNLLVFFTYIASNMLRKSYSKNHCCSKKKYFCLFIEFSPEAKKIGQWSEATLVLLHAKQSGCLSSHSVDTKILSSVTMTGQVCLLVQVYLAPFL
jgi:hypothetical protein